MSDTNTNISYRFAKKYGVIAQAAEKYVTVYHEKPILPTVLHELKRHFQQPLQPELLSTEAFAQKLAQHYTRPNPTTREMVAGVEESLDLSYVIRSLPPPEDLLDTKDEAPMIRLLNALLAEAIKQHASDIHIESYAHTLLIRFRIDGLLRQALDVPRSFGPLLISRLKIMGKLDIAEKRLPQDGHIVLTVANKQVDVRIATLPSSHAERIVLRLLDKQVAQLKLAHLGMAEPELKIMQRLIHQPSGLILVTGPTGSGKTTSLYAILTELNKPTRNILTVEDPIEYDLPGISQTQVNRNSPLTFATGLRALLRQDPDVIMVGEIRDAETANMAIQASLTGHLVLSTLHTNSAISAVTRLQELGVPPFLLASSVMAILAQRLVRVLCPACKQPHQASPQECQWLGIEEGSATIYSPAGCEQCANQGYQGRRGIYELIAIDAPLRTLMHQPYNESELTEKVRQTSRSLIQAGQRKVLSGETSLEEVLRVTTWE